LGDEKNRIYLVRVDGSGKPELLLDSGGAIAFPSSWTPDGRELFYTRRDSAGKFSIWTLPAPASGGDHKPHLFLQDSFNIGRLISPDGRWVAYYSDESGSDGVFVRPFAGSGGKVPISTQPAYGLKWSRNGRELFYIGKNDLYSVGVHPGPDFRAGPAQSLFKCSQMPSPCGSSGPETLNEAAEMFEGVFDVATDGKRVLVAKAVEAPPYSAKMQVVVNWFEELRMRVPVRK
jgi:hypothetical protein